MSVFRVVIAGAAALVLSAAVAPRASALMAQESGASSSGNYQVPQQTVNLSPMVVYGNHIPFPIALQLIKKAINQPWSTSRADQNKLVCRFVYMQGSRLQTLRCETNGQHFREQQATQLAMTNAYSQRSPDGTYFLKGVATGMIPVVVGNWATNHWVNPGAMLTLLKKLPPADSSYTLQVTVHGKPVIEYVIKNGELVAVRKTLYKNQKQH